MKRRNFLKSSIASTLILENSIDKRQNFKLNLKMEASKLLFFQTNWGFEGNLDSFCSKVKKEGYDGIEIWWPNSKNEQDELAVCLGKYDLKIGFLCGGSQNNAKLHFETFKNALDAATSWQIKPQYINCHSGRDFFSYEENQKFIEYTTKKALETNILICHETHRGRMLFAAHITKHFIDKNPDLKLTLDISHWCNVHESLLDDQPENVLAALERTHHIHARIGHQEGPQVNDPRAPEWKEALQKHLEWWDVVVKRKKEKGEVITFLTEFGPPNYLQTLPFTNQPVADQWEINVFMMKMLKERYQK